MRLAEMKQLPPKAGKAILDWNEKVLPQRNDRHIVLPHSHDVEFFWVVEAVQFLIVSHHNNGWSRSPSCWFGGTDEEPFLVELQPEVLPTFLKDGWQGFYRALQPPYVATADQKGQPWLRQGDIFAIQLPLTWEQLLRKMLLEQPKVSIESAKDQAIYGTRHQIQRGLAITGDYRLKPIIGEFGLIAEGELVAPDHKPHTLAGPHLLLQTQFLSHPQKAD